MKIRSLGILSMVVACTACGMAERDDEDAKSYEYLRFTDERFEAYCLSAFDTNQDGRFSRYEAESVRLVACPSMQITSLSPIEAFVNLETLDCSNNNIDRLDLEHNLELQHINCANNALTELSLGRLRRLSYLDCRTNRLTALLVDNTHSLQWLDCRGNNITMLDLSPCNISLQADTRANPELSIIYYRAGQQINYEAPAVLVAR